MARIKHKPEDGDKMQQALKSSHDHDKLESCYSYFKQQGQNQVRYPVLI